MRTSCLAQGTLRSALCNLHEKEIYKEGDTHTYITDSLSSTAETNKPL